MTYQDRLKAYFIPGTIVKSYGGQDRVISIETDRAGWPFWRAWVQEVNADGNPIAPMRWHCTDPTSK